MTTGFVTKISKKSKFAESVATPDEKILGSVIIQTAFKCSIAALTKGQEQSDKNIYYFYESSKRIFIEFAYPIKLGTIAIISNSIRYVKHKLHNK